MKFRSAQWFYFLINSILAISTAYHLFWKHSSLALDSLRCSKSADEENRPQYQYLLKSSKINPNVESIWKLTSMGTKLTTLFLPKTFWYMPWKHYRWWEREWKRTPSRLSQVFWYLILFWVWPILQAWVFLLLELFLLQAEFFIPLLFVFVILRVIQVFSQAQVPGLIHLLVVLGFLLVDLVIVIVELHFPLPQTYDKL